MFSTVNYVYIIPSFLAQNSITDDIICKLLHMLLNELASYFTLINVTRLKKLTSPQITVLCEFGMDVGICTKSKITKQHVLIKILTKISQVKFTEPGGRLNKKDGLTRYGNSHVKDKTS